MDWLWDWTTEAVEYNQSTSSRGYPLGVCVGVMTPAVARKYRQEGKVSHDDCAMALAGRAALGSPTSMRLPLKSGFFFCKPFGAYASKGCRGATDRAKVGERPTPAICD